MLETVDRAYELYREKSTGTLLRGIARSYLPDIADRWAALVEQEAKTRALFPMPKRRWLWLYRHGFLSQTDVLYDFERYDPSDYLSNYARYVRTPEINGRWSFLLDNKLAFHWLMEPFEDHRPALYGLIESGTLYRSPTLRVASSADAIGPNGSGDGDGDGGDAIPDPGRWVLDRLRKEGSLVIKPVTGGSGDNVLVCRREEGGYRVNGEGTTADDLRSTVADLDGYLVFEFVTQAAYSDDLFPDTDEGEFTIIEANSFTDINVFQTHTPLLTDPRVRPVLRRSGRHLTADAVSNDRRRVGFYTGRPSLAVPMSNDPAARPVVARAARTIGARSTVPVRSNRAALATNRAIPAIVFR